MVVGDGRANREGAEPKRLWGTRIAAADQIEAANHAAFPRSFGRVPDGMRLATVLITPGRPIVGNTRNKENFDMKRILSALAALMFAGALALPAAAQMSSPAAPAAADTSAPAMSHHMKHKKHMSKRHKKHKKAPASESSPAAQ